MKKKEPPIPKDARRMFRDLLDHHGNLRSAMARFDGGESGACKDVLMNLRTLIGKKEGGRYNGLLFYMAETYQFELGTHVLRLLPNPTTNQLEEQYDPVSLAGYLDRRSVNGGVAFTNGDFVWQYASQDAAHTDTGLSLQYVANENTFYQGVDMNQFYAMKIARTIEPIVSGLIPLIERKMANK